MRGTNMKTIVWSFCKTENKRVRDLNVMQWDSGHVQECE